MDHVLFASRLTQKGDSLRHSLDAHVAVAMHTGSGQSINPKHWPCEDSLCAHRLEDGGLLAAVADSHWGGQASEAVAGGLKPCWEAVSGSGVPRLERALLEIEARRVKTRDPNDPSETTVLLVHVQDRTVNYLSVGDSLLIVVGPTGARVHNVPQGYFFGRFPLIDVPRAIDGGRLHLAPGELLLLASDGLEPNACALQLPQIAELMRGDAPLETRLERLLARANDTAQGGGRDNLALVAIEP